VVIAEHEVLNPLQELEAFLERYDRERVVRIVTVENGVKGNICLVSNSDDVCLRRQAVVADVSFRGGEIVIVQLSEDVALDEGGEAFVEPVVLPVVGGDLVAGPRLSNVSHEHVFLGFVTYYGSLRSVSKHGVRHTAHREGGRHNDNSV